MNSPTPNATEALDAPKAGGRILVVDDERNIRSTLELLLREDGYAVDTAADGDAAERILATTPPDVILLDVRLPGRSGLDCLRDWRRHYPALPVILMSGEATITEAVDGLKEGAYDFIEKPFLSARLLKALHRALERLRLRESVQPGPEADTIIGRSPALLQILAHIEKVAPTRSRVLVTGESGTGKDLLARALHRASPRRDARFVKINCAAIPAELIESELFGHVKGAFTGAHAARRGLFETASGGTLFLDEIGDLSLTAQAKILRALQNGEITPVGSNVTISVDVRVVAATNRDLKAAVDAGVFREDLYYRLAVVTVESPPLRQRAEDVPLLVRHFLEAIRHEYGLPPKHLDPEVLAILGGYRWPGNIRELRNVIERLMILSGPVIGRSDLPIDIVKDAATAPPPAAAADAVFTPQPWDRFKLDSERNYLIQTLRHCSGNISEAARLLEIERSTIHKWLKSLQIEKRHYLA